MTPYFSIIITVYNKEKYIAQTLNSVLNQSFTDFEVIIINDGSTDTSLKVLQTFDDKRIRLLDQNNHGASHARNHGMSLATANFIALIDGDDLWDSEFLTAMVQAINTYPNESVFTSAIAHKYDDKIVPVPYSFKLDKDILKLDYFKASQKHSVLSGSSIVLKKPILEVTGNFDPSIKSGEDTDFWIRIGIHYPIVFFNTVLAYYIYNTDSLSNTSFSINGKPKFDNYRKEEDTNFYLKKFLDRNRFSLAVLSKLNDDIEFYKTYRNSLSIKNLSLRQRLIIDCPKWLISWLLKIKSLGGKKLYYKSL